MSRWNRSGYVLLLILAALCGCGTTRKLKITEVGVGVLELYLNEPTANSLSLSDHVLVCKSVDPATGMTHQAEVELFGTLDGGRFLVVFEDANHTGPPVTSSYTNFYNRSVDAIAVEPGTLGGTDNSFSYAHRVTGSHTRYIFPFFFIIDKTDDVVTFGPRPRPSVGGAFTETGALDAVMRTTAQSFVRGRTVWRRSPSVAGVRVPQDNDTEDDWREDDESFGEVN